jgi:hypothetical protein
VIASFLTESNQQQTVHVVFHVAREGLKVKTHGYCGAQGNAGDGTYQTPEWVFDGRPTVNLSNIVWQVCPKCAATVKSLREPPH